MNTNTINIYRNPNFTQWFNIVLNGKLIDNVGSYAKAMQLAKKMQKENQASIISSN